MVAFKVTGGEQGGWAVLHVSGELDLVTSPVLRQRVHDEVAEGRHSLVLDLSEVFFCDSSGSSAGPSNTSPVGLKREP